METEHIWANWVSLQQLGLEHRTGRLLGFYAGRHYVSIDIENGSIAAVQASDRELRIEHVIVRLEMVAPQRLRIGLHDLARHDEKASVIPYLLRTQSINRRSLAQARERQMIDIMRTLLTTRDVSVAFIDQPHVQQSVETAIRIGDALASAYAEEPFLQARSPEPKPRDVSLLLAPILEMRKPDSKRHSIRQRRTI